MPTQPPQRPPPDPWKAPLLVRLRRIFVFAGSFLLMMVSIPSASGALGFVCLLVLAAGITYMFEVVERFLG